MRLADSAMRWGLRAINRFAGSAAIDRLKLRKNAERLLFQGAKAGFRSAGAASRSFSSLQKLMQPMRPARVGGEGLFDLTPSEEQQMLREAALRFGKERLRSQAQAADAACRAPVDLLEEAAQLGLATLGIPEALGGAGSERSAVTQVLVAEALAQGDMSLALACLAPVAVSNALALWGDEVQQSTYLPAFVGDNIPAAALAVLEPRPLFDAWSLQTRARRKTGGGFEVSGLKSLVPRAAEAELFIVAAQLEMEGPALFIIESKSAGLTLAPEPAMGLRAASTGRLALDGVQLAPGALLGGASREVYAEMLALSRVGWCALATGAAQAALDYLVPYVNERVAFGEPISHRQAVAFDVANIAIELEGMRLLTYRAASRAERGEPFMQQAALAQRLCADKGMKIGSDAVQLLGGHGFIKEHPVERWYRDLRACAVMEGAVLV